MIGDSRDPSVMRRRFTVQRRRPSTRRHVLTRRSRWTVCTITGCRQVVA
jgi:hypothetical protein